MHHVNKNTSLYWLLTPLMVVFLCINFYSTPSPQRITPSISTKSLTVQLVTNKMTISPHFKAGNHATDHSGSAVSCQHHHINYVPTYTWQYLSLLSFDNEIPEYKLASEILMPKHPLLNIGYRQNRNRQSDWMLMVKATPSRISSWKDSNLIYRFTQQV